MDGNFFLVRDFFTLAIFPNPDFFALRDATDRGDATDFDLVFVRLGGRTEDFDFLADVLRTFRFAVVDFARGFFATDRFAVVDFARGFFATDRFAVVDLLVVLFLLVVVLAFLRDLAFTEEVLLLAFLRFLVLVEEERFAAEVLFETRDGFPPEPFVLFVEVIGS